MTQTAGAEPATRLRIDENDPFGAQVASHLREDLVVWLTTVSPRGMPSPNPVWFLWDGLSTVSVFSVGHAARARHLRANPQVSLNFTGRKPGDVIVISGIAVENHCGPAADQVPEYLAKYAGLMHRLGMTPRTFAASHCLPLSISLTRMRGLPPLSRAEPLSGALPPAGTPGGAER